MQHLVTTNENLVCLYRFIGNFRLADTKVGDHLDHAAMGVVVDTETTGVGPLDTVIELAILPFFFDKRDGQRLEVCEPYVGLQDPGVALAPEVIEITGLHDADVRGQSIDWKRAIQILGNADFVVAWNARFDRPMVHKAIAAAGLRPPRAAWVCAMVDIPWRKLPQKPPSLALGVVAAWHGFFFSAHRALSDCKATIHLLSIANQVLTLATRATQSSWLVAADKAAFFAKDTIKARGGYQWDADRKYWWLEVANKKLAEAEVAWLGANVYTRGPNTALCLEVPATERFL